MTLFELHVNFGLPQALVDLLEGRGLTDLSAIRSHFMAHETFQNIEGMDVRMENELLNVLTCDALIRSNTIAPVRPQLVAAKRSQEPRSRTTTSSIHDSTRLTELGGLFQLSVRAINACNGAGLTDVAKLREFHTAHGTFKNLRNCGSKTQFELLDLVTRISHANTSPEPTQTQEDACTEAQMSEPMNDWIKRHGIDHISLARSLDTKDSSTLFRFLSDYLYLSTGRSRDDVYRALLQGSGHVGNLQELGDRLGLSRERVRQIIQGMPKALAKSLEFLGDLPTARQQYPSLFPDEAFLVIDNDLVRMINDGEGTNWSHLFIGYVAQALNAGRFVRCDWADLFERTGHSGELSGSSSLLLEADLAPVVTATLQGLVARFPRKRSQVMRHDLFRGQHSMEQQMRHRLVSVFEALILRVYPGVTCEAGWVSLPSNQKRKQIDLLEDVLAALNEPSHGTAIVEEWHRRFPEHRISAEAIRSIVVRAPQRFFSIGRTSTYGLRRWEKERNDLKGGTIRDIAFGLLDESDRPLHFDELTTVIQHYRSTTTAPSVRSNLQLDQSHRFVFLVGGYVGIANKVYAGRTDSLISIPGKLVRRKLVSRFVGRPVAELIAHLQEASAAEPSVVEARVKRSVNEGRILLSPSGIILHTTSMPPEDDQQGSFTGALPFKD